ncbi:MAG: hypothetical protein LBU80_03935 [Rikenellaceae bacterium]|nr:hypothetical protein [Rikenellaceae bacterium]
MKKSLVFALCLWLLAGGLLSARTQDGGKGFTIRGEIAGLTVGDTLRFERIELPGWSLESAFDVVVASPGHFEHTGQQPHTEYYMMSYLPRTGQAPGSSRRGLTIIIDGGTVTVTGSTDEIYFSRVEGEAFGEQPLLREAAALDDSIQQERSRNLQLAYAAFAAGDSIKGREHERRFNEFQREEESKRIRALESEFLNRHPSSPWSIVYRLERAANTPTDSLEAYYTRLDAPARASHYGTVLRKTIDDLVRLAPGQPAPVFGFMLPDGMKMSSDKFWGKYLLIYHWGFCPGSIQLEEEATDLFNRYKENLGILGITDNLESIRDAARTTPPDAELFGMNLKTAYESMAVHPWIDIEDTGENHRIGDLYAFGGYPFFVLISPDGKIVSRGFHETFYETEKMLKAEFGPKQ